MAAGTPQTLHCETKTHQIFFYHNLKKSDTILIGFGTNIPDTTDHLMTV